jgi:hypothetical protein
MLKAQHPEFEVWSQGVHARAGRRVPTATCRSSASGAMKVSNHHVRSPLLNIAQSCQVCHNVPEQELLARAHATQDRTQALVDRGSAALVELIAAVTTAREAGATDEQLADALQRSGARSGVRLRLLGGVARLPRAAGDGSASWQKRSTTRGRVRRCAPAAARAWTLGPVMSSRREARRAAPAVWPAVPARSRRAGPRRS